MRSFAFLLVGAIALVAFIAVSDVETGSNGRKLLSDNMPGPIRRLLQFLQTSGSFTMSMNDDGTMSTSGSFTMYTSSPENEEPTETATTEEAEVEASFNEEPAPALKEAAATCKTDDDCHTGGDMGGYCKENGDCHCTASFFASKDGSCALSCTPTSTTPCCRDDKDCQAGGDADAYCKSPKSTLHTTPGNGMCRCTAGFTGTTACSKAAPSIMVALGPLAIPMHHQHLPAGLCLFSVLAALAVVALMLRRRRASGLLEGQYKTVLATAAPNTSEDQL